MIARLLAWLLPDPSYCLSCTYCEDTSLHYTMSHARQASWTHYYSTGHSSSMITGRAHG